MKSGLFLVVLWVSMGVSIAQQAPAIHWVKFEELDSLQKKEQRPVFIFLHTSWCGYCKLFERRSLRNPEVIQQLNRYFYCVDFDAESKQSITFRGRVWKFQPTGIETGLHEMTTYLLQPYKVSAYPGLLFRDASFKPVTGIFSALSPNEFLQLTDQVAALYKAGD